MHYQKNIFILITGPSGVGKTTITQCLIERIKKSTRLITTTTREKRPGESSGVDYNFITTEKFLKMKDGGKFFECAKVYDKHYGSERKKLEELLEKHPVVFSVVDVKGAQTIKKKMPNTLTIFISPGSLDELYLRLSKRESACDKDLKKRIEKAEYEMSIAQEFDEVINNVNGKLEETIDKTLLYINTRQNQKFTT